MALYSDPQEVTFRIPIGMLNVLLYGARKRGLNIDDFLLETLHEPMSAIQRKYQEENTLVGTSMEQELQRRENLRNFWRT